MTEKAVVLYSGGLDSTTCMAIARAEGFAPYAMSFAYGQRHAIELDKARQYAPLIGAAAHQVVEINLRDIGGSALTSDIDVPKGRQIDDGIPVTYVPARNTIFLSFALGWAEVLGADDIFLGVNALDYSGYPDCRPEFIEAFEQLAQGQPIRGRAGEARQDLAARQDPDLARAALDDRVAHRHLAVRAEHDLAVATHTQDRRRADAGARDQLFVV
jgi:7-cyano-7-deazaguanine synthase